ncbi:MAG: nucleotidyltransferase family protein [Spirochaetes bacterium]|nr:nucleotidyltransferase family protein [Spirochaetota bacterium]
MGMKMEHMLSVELCRKKPNRQLVENVVRAAGFNRDYFFHILHRHMVMPAALERLLQYSLPEPMKRSMASAAKEVVLGTTLFNNMIKNELFRIRSILKGGGIEYILMKGLSLDFSGIRTIGDLDILVREKDLLAADRLVREGGFEYVGGMLNPLIKDSEKNDLSSQLGWNNQFQYINPKNRLLLELHTNLFERGRAYLFNLDPLLDAIGSFWENRTWDGALGCHVFSMDDRLILMCLHTALKRSPYANMFVLRNLTDIAAIIERGVDWENVVSRARAMRVVSFLLFSLAFAVRILGTDVPGAVLEGLRAECGGGERLLVALHLRCFHNLESSRLLYSQLYKILAPFVYQKKWLPRMRQAFLIPVLFPSRWRMSGIYRVRKDSPLIYFTYLLNPFRWIYLSVRRLIRLVF